MGHPTERCRVICQLPITETGSSVTQNGSRADETDETDESRKREAARETKWPAGRPSPWPKIIETHRERNDIDGWVLSVKGRN